MSERFVERMSPSEINSSFRKLLGILSQKRWHAGYRDSIRVHGRAAKQAKKKRICK